VTAAAAAGIPVRLSAPWVIACAGQKGGVGKTTIALGLAATFADISGRALVVDVDAQASATEIADEAGEGLPFDFAASTDPAELAALRAARDYDAIFVDLPGSLDGLGVLGQVMRSADLVIIPMVPERQAVTPTLRTARAVAAAGVPYRVVLNQVDPLRGAGPAEAAWELLDREQIPRMRSFIRRYVAHSQSQLDGLMVTQYRGDRSWRSALDDMRKVQTELLLILGRMGDER
jgi:chromosome partitioning protein